MPFAKCIFLLIFSYFSSFKSSCCFIFHATIYYSTNKNCEVYCDLFESALLNLSVTFFLLVLSDEDEEGLEDEEEEDLDDDDEVGLDAVYKDNLEEESDGDDYEGEAGEEEDDDVLDEEEEDGVEDAEDGADGADAAEEDDEADGTSEEGMVFPVPFGYIY